MTTKKQSRANQKRRQESYEARLAARRARRNRNQKVVGFVTVAILLVTGGLAASGAFSPNSPAASPSPSADPVVSAQPDPAPTFISTDGTATPPLDLAEGRDWTVALGINDQVVSVTLDGAAAPTAVASFVFLAQQGYFDGTPCHRLLTSGIFVLQCGDPTGTGTGGPGYDFGPVENDPDGDFYPAGTIAMARVSGNGYSMGSQFFIVYQDSTIPSDIAGGYTIMGKVTSGLEVVTVIAAQGNASGGEGTTPLNPVILTTVTAS